MGLNATLSVITPTEFLKYPQSNPAPSVEFDLWKDWSLLDLALQELPEPLHCAIRGNMPTLDEFDADWDAYDSFTSPDCVRDIDSALRNLADDEMLNALLAAGMKNRKQERDEQLATFEVLKNAYAEAAKQEAYIRIFIC